jgi:hypothetical protein
MVLRPKEKMWLKVPRQRTSLCYQMSISIVSLRLRHKLHDMLETQDDHTHRIAIALAYVGSMC